MKLKKINIILLLFVFLTAAIVVGGWHFINSKTFSDDLSEKVSRILLEKSSLNLTFEKVDFIAFPPKTIIKNIKIKHKIDEVLELDLRADSVEVNFSLTNIFSKKLELSEVSLINSVVNIKDLSKEDSGFKLEDIKIKEYFKKYQEFAFETLPVTLDRLFIFNSNLHINQHSLYVKELKTLINRKNFKVKADIEDINYCLDLSCKKQEKIERLSTNLNVLNDLVDFQNISIIYKNSEASGKFKFLGNEFKNLNLNSSVNLKINLEDHNSNINYLINGIGNLKGIVNVDLNSDGNLTKSLKNFTFNGRDFSSDWINLEKISGELLLSGKGLILKNFAAEKDNEKYELIKRADFFEFKTNWFKEGSYFLKVEKIKTNNFLKSVKSLDPLKLSATGLFEVEYKKSKVFIKSSKFKVEQAELRFNSSTPLLKIYDLEAQKFELSIDENYSVDLLASIGEKNNFINFSGKIDENSIDISILPKSRIDWNKIGGISGVKIQGAGPVEGKISGPLEDVAFDLKADWKNFEVVDLKFGEVKGDFVFRLKDLSLNLKEITGVSFGNQYSGSGSLFFGDHSGMDLGFKLVDSSYINSLKMFPLIFKNLNMPDFVNFKFNSEIKISGPFDVKNMLASGKVKGTNGSVKGEEFDSIEFNFNLKKSQLEFEDINLKKFKAQISSWVKVNLESGFLEFKGQSSNLYLNDFDSYRNLRLGYQGKIDFNFEGNGTKENLSSRYKLKLSEASIANMSVPGASALAFFDGKEFTVTGNVLGNKIKFDSILNFEDKLSSFKLKIDTNEIKEILGAVSSHNLSSAKLNGKIKGSMDLLFELKDLAVKKFSLMFQELNINKDNFSLNLDSQKSSVLIEDGVIKKWNLKLNGVDDFLESKGYLLNNGDVKVVNQFQFDSSVIELFSPELQKLSGKIRGESQLQIGKGIELKTLDFFGENILIKFKDLKNPISDINLAISKTSKNEISLKKFEGVFGDGKVQATGRAIFDSLIPNLYLNFSVDKASMPLFKKSTITFSANGDVSGDKLPYLVKGKINLLYGEFLDDPADFLDDKKLNLNVYNNFLPTEKGLLVDDLLAINFQYDTVNPILVKNNLAEVYLKGNGSIQGTPKKPELNTRIEVTSNLSRFKFKGNDFNISQGFVEIRDINRNRQSEVRFIGLTKLNGYDLKLEISGPVEKVSINLTSEPPLSKDDLLSLLTLGVTNDISKNLDSNDRKFVTTVGIGTLLVDQFKINEDLNSMFGVKLSVLPEFQEDEAQLIQGKNAVSDSTSSKLKSSTKVKLDKKLSKNIDLSVSSTVGGSLEQKQEMNLNFNIDKNWSVEGVYELKNTNTDEGESSNSVGADVKYKWSF